jgi:hypothetical protein
MNARKIQNGSIAFSSSILVRSRPILAHSGLLWIRDVRALLNASGLRMEEGRKVEAFDYGQDIYTEADGDDDTLANLGPLRALAGSWTGDLGEDIHPIGRGSEITGLVVDRDEHNVFIERYELQPIDPQTNGPQLFYGLRYHTHIVRPGEIETFHDQVGYWLWEPAAHTVLLSLAIPRGQVALAAGPAEPDATEFEVRATLGPQTYGILSNPFLDRAFQTVGFRMRVTVHDDGTWSYEQHTEMQIPDRDGVVDHVDRNTLKRTGEPNANPLASNVP